MIKNKPLFILLNSIIIVSILLILIFIAPAIPTFFHYFTVLSNIFMAFVSILVILIALKKKPSKTQTKIIDNIYLIATTSLILVFLVVAFFLAPRSENYFFLFSDYNFFMHFFNPLLATISLLLLKKPKFNLISRLLTLLPPFIYAIIYFFFVMVLKAWPDFYNFTFGGKIYYATISLTVIMVTVFIISSLLSFLCNKNQK